MYLDSLQIECLKTEEEEEREAIPFLPYQDHLTPPSNSTPRRNLRLILYGTVSFLFGSFFTLFALKFVPLIGRNSHLITYETGFSEELILPSSAIQLESRRFTTPVDFYLNGTEYLVSSPEERIYVGAPSSEIDRNWEELLWGRYFSISEEEAKALWGGKYNEFRDRRLTGFTGGFDMFHQLHCLNQIRQAFHRDYYPEIPIHGSVHLDHCINHLRQAILCWGNTAVIPIKWFEGYHDGYVKSDALHTCRKFEPIREFVSERFNGSLYVPREITGLAEDANGF